MKNPIVIDPPGFDQDAAWGECRDFVDKCGGLSHEDGEPNWRAAFGADPGICSCPACGESYWCWGQRQRCVKCGFEYPTDAWSAYSYGVHAGRSESARKFYLNQPHYAENPYFKYGLAHPVEDAFKEFNSLNWREIMSNSDTVKGGATT